MVRVKISLRVFSVVGFKNHNDLSDISSNYPSIVFPLNRSEINLYPLSSREKNGFVFHDMGRSREDRYLEIYEILIYQGAYLEKTKRKEGTARNGTKKSMKLGHNISHHLEFRKGRGRYCDLKRTTWLIFSKSIITLATLGNFQVASAVVVEKGSIESLTQTTHALLVDQWASSGLSKEKSKNHDRVNVPSKLSSDSMPIESLLMAQPQQLNRLEELVRSSRIARDLPKTLKKPENGEGAIVRVVIPEEEGDPVAQIVHSKSSSDGKLITTSPVNKIDNSKTQILDQRSYSKPVYKIQRSKVTGGLELSPSVISIPEVGNVVEVELSEGSDLSFQKELKIFVRHSKIAQINKQDKFLTFEGLAVGNTEAYFVLDGHMVIAPLEVRSSALMVKRDEGNDLFRPLQLAREVVSLQDLSPREIRGSLSHFEAPKSDIYPFDGEARTRLDDTADQLVKEKSNAVDDTINSVSPSQNLVSLNQSIKETENSLKEQAEQQANIRTEPEDFASTDVTIQVVDDRTPLIKQNETANPLVYPVAGVRVEIPGTNFEGQTDSMGYLVIRGVPRYSSILMKISDTSGAMIDTVAEIQAHEGVQRVVMHRAFAYELAQNLAGVVATVDTGSVCAALDSDFPSGQTFKVSTVGVENDVYYTNNQGVIDTALKSTADTGKFCIFNANPGPMTIRVETSSPSDNVMYWTFSFGIYSVAHQNIVLPLDLNRQSFETKLVSLGSAHEQLASQESKESAMRPVDYTEAFVLGQSISMGQPTVGHLESQTGLDFYHGTGYFYVEAPEFESAIYPVKSDALTAHVTPLIPRGFIEDMALYAQVIRDPNKGTVFAEFAHFRGQSSAVNIKLVDQFGEVMGNSWYFGDNPLTKALFFNVDPGRYSLVVETREGDWLASQVINVYSETSSFIRMGERLVALE